jgi:hypothetical protein
MLPLIDKQDGFEIVRDQIQTILVTEIANQQVLAAGAGKDPDLWKIRVYSERANPWESVLNQQTDFTPICNVWYTTSSFPEDTGNVVGRQKNVGVYNLDIYGFGIAEDVTGGHQPGDKAAAYNAQRAVRLIRNILMAGDYTYLGLRGTIWKRWINSITMFQPEFDARAMQQVVGARIAFRVEFNDFSPQAEFDTLEYISTTVYRAEDDEILVVIDVDHT